MAKSTLILYGLYVLDISKWAFLEQNCTPPPFLGCKSFLDFQSVLSWCHGKWDMVIFYNRFLVDILLSSSGSYTTAIEYKVITNMPLKGKLNF